MKVISFLMDVSDVSDVQAILYVDDVLIKIRHNRLCVQMLFSSLGIILFNPFKLSQGNSELIRATH